MISLTWTELQFVLAPEGPWESPAFTGSMFRGALGMALRQSVCVMHRPVCTGCPLIGACVYARLFETRPDPAAAVMRRYDRAPHPFLVVAVLRDALGQDRAEAGTETLAVRLFGADLDSAPFVARAVEVMAARGLGRDRVPFRLREVRDGSGPAAAEGTGYARPLPAPPPPHLPARRRWHLDSPLRLLKDGRPLDAARLDGPAIGRAVLRRVGLMAQFYGTLDPGTDFAALAAEADRLRIVERQLAWRPLVRWSSRQGTRQSIGGVTGTLVLDFEGAPGLARLADWVPIVHLGKETSLGLGAITAEAA